MKTFKALGAIAALLVCAVSSEAVVNIQSVGAGARAQALGNSYVAVADDADAIFENPAGLGQLENKSLFQENLDDLLITKDLDPLRQNPDYC